MQAKASDQICLEEMYCVEISLENRAYFIHLDVHQILLG